MSIPRGYVPNHKFWDNMGRVTPNVEWSESHRPHFESFAAPWLPTQRFDKEYEYYITVSAGKVVAEDLRGHIVPAGFKKAWNVAKATGSVLVYTAADVAEKVIDLTTGVFVAAAVTYTEEEVTDALRLRGLIRPAERAMDFISKPIGIASYNYWKAAGPDHYNPAELYQHNFRPQALVAITCDYVATYPVLPAVATDETTDGALQNGATDLDWDANVRDGGWFGSTAINGLTAYSGLVAADADVVAYVTEKYPVAHNTSDSPVSASVAGLINEVATVGAVSAAGDWFFDYKLGMLFVYEAGGDAIPSPWSVSTTLTYYHYEDEVSSGVSLSSYACATGNLEYGDFLTYDVNSNLVKAVLDIANAEGYVDDDNEYDTDPEYDTNTDNAAVSAQIEAAVSGYTTGIIGQIIGTTEFPRDYLDRVRTAYSGGVSSPNSYLGIGQQTSMQTPGSATGGRTDQLTYSNSAEKMIIVNLILR